jgi:hypothetical protein
VPSFRRPKPEEIALVTGDVDQFAGGRIGGADANATGLDDELRIPNLQAVDRQCKRLGYCVARLCDAVDLFLAPDAAVERADLIDITDIGDKVFARRDLFPGVVAPIGDGSGRRGAPSRTGFAGWQDIASAVHGRTGLGGDRRALHGQLHQRTKAKRRFVDGNVLLGPGPRIQVNGPVSRGWIRDK